MNIKELLDEYAQMSRDDEDYYPDTERMQEIIQELETSIRKEVVAEERQFILNVLDGIDIADKEMGVIGGTQAIRFALQSRV